jgi:hypothetical protein
VQINDVGDEFIWMLRFYPVASEQRERKVTEVEGNYYVSSTLDSGRNNVSIFGIRELDTQNQVFVALNQTIWNSIVHQFTCSLQLLWLEVGAIG